MCGRKDFNLGFIFPSFCQPSLSAVKLAVEDHPLKRRVNYTFPCSVPVRSLTIFMQTRTSAVLSPLARRRSGTQLILLAACLCMAVSAAAQNGGRAGLVDPNLPEYQPQPVPTPHDHGYVMPDGSVRIVGFDDMAGMVAKWDQEFTRTHPGIKFTPILKGNGTAIPAITYDMTAFAPEGGGATLLELLPYEKIYGSKKDPVAALIIRVGHGSLNPSAKMSPLGIIVNKSNPIKSLTEEQVASIFSTGSGTGRRHQLEPDWDGRRSGR